MTSQRWIVLPLLLGWLVFAPGAARAATVAIQEPIQFERADERSLEEGGDKINLQDCLDDITVTFPVNLVANGDALQVWVGRESCRDSQARTDGRCQRAWSGDVSSQDDFIEIGALDLIRGELTGDDCNTFPDRDPVTMTILFTFLGSNGLPSDVNGEWAEYALEFDLKGPEPPVITKTSAGDGKIFLKWEENSNIGLMGYNFYCAPQGENVSQVMGEAGQSGLSTDCASALIPGAVPDSMYSCGEVTGQTVTSGTARDGVVNGTQYAVGVAAVDSVGNVGDLAVANDCVIPQEVTDYFEAYVAAGGEGGGGFCAFGLRRPGSFSALTFLALIGFTARRRQRS